MKIINLIKCEFIKNYTLKKIMLIILMLLVSVVAITKINSMFYKDNIYNVTSELSYAKWESNSYKSDGPITSLKEKYYYNSIKNRIDMLEKMEKTGNITQDSWQFNSWFNVLNLQNDNMVIHQLINEKEEELLKICNSNNIQYDEYEGRIKLFCDKSIEELKIIENENNQKINKYKDILDENKYYKLIEYFLDTNKIEQQLVSYYQKIVDEKIESDLDYRVRNLYQKMQLDSNSTDVLLSKSTFMSEASSYNEYKDYETYLRFSNDLKADNEEKLAIVNYSILNSKKHDIVFNDYNLINQDKTYISSKSAVNQIFNVSIVVMLLVIITSAGIVSNEHSKGTEKLLLTSPIKRWKIVLSKFLYLILHTYIIWFIALFLISLYSGFKYGFSDLFNSKLLYESGHVVEVNYFFYIIKNMFICGIPIISFVSIMFAISTITLKTTLSIGICTILTCVSPILWYIIYTYKFWFIAYTPFPYLDYNLIFDKFEYYLLSTKYINITDNTGIIISIITIVIMYLLSLIMYLKRDIKN